MEKETDFKGLFRLFTRSIIISMIGMIFPFLYILFPSMYVVESVKEGIIKVMATLIAVVFLIGAILGPMEAIIIFTIFGPFILIFHYMISTNRSVAATILATSLIFFTSIMVLFFAFGINSEVLNSRETIKCNYKFLYKYCKRCWPFSRWFNSFFSKCRNLLQGIFTNISFYFNNFICSYFIYNLYNSWQNSPFQGKVYNATFFSWIFKISKRNNFAISCNTCNFCFSWWLFWNKRSNFYLKFNEFTLFYAFCSWNKCP